MDHPDKIMSTEYDIVYYMEVIEGSETDWEQLITRLRNYVIPWQQIIGDTNPGAPMHWLKLREARGVLKMLNASHKDNPTLWDQVRKVWTARGEDYLKKLKNLSGVRKLRLLNGIWAATEGAVYENWDAAVHLIDPFEIPSDWRRVRVIDFGFTNPFVCQWWAIDPDERLYLYREIYMSQRIVADHAQRILELSEGETYEATIADHDAEDRATLAKAGIRTKAAYKAVMQGIQAVQKRLKAAGDGRPRIFIFRDTLDELDTELEAHKKPLCTVQEIDAYVWHRGADGKANKEEPVKIDDHGVDAIRYVVAYVDRIKGGGVRIRED
jgi:PBSX family phage terminase large subunit